MSRSRRNYVLLITTIAVAMVALLVTLRSPTRLSDQIPQKAPNSGEYYIGGVKRTGVYSLSHRSITLSQAFYSAGATAASDSDIVYVALTRKTPDGNAELIKIAGDAFLKTGDGDLRLQNDDVIEVVCKRNKATK